MILHPIHALLNARSQRKAYSPRKELAVSLTFYPKSLNVEGYAPFKTVSLLSLAFEAMSGLLTNEFVEVTLCALKRIALHHSWQWLPALAVLLQ